MVEFTSTPLIRKVLRESSVVCMRVSVYFADRLHYSQISNSIMLPSGIPMALIIEQAGGIASTGLFEGKIGRVAELTPDAIHCKCPIIMGGPRDVGVVYSCYKKHGVETPEL